MLARYFGVSLSDIVRREKHAVPNILINITAHICKQGIDAVGIFRPNGNAKILDKFRSSYDKTGDADFRNCTDVMTVAALLKVFLRELPDGLIPLKLTSQFVAAQDICIKDPQECLRVMKHLLQQLPRESYATLKYLIAFLVLVTLEEEANKMSAMALAIVFGPAIFRCASGFEGLKEQGVTNYITLTFIMKFDVLFLDNGEISPYSPDFLLSDCCKGIDIDVLKIDSSMHSYESISDDDSLCSPCSPKSPPFIDSESSETSSAVALTVSAMLQRAIRHAVCRHAFAEMASSSSDDSENSEDSDNSHSSLRMNDFGSQNREDTLTRKTAGSISGSGPSVDRTLATKPVAAIIPNSSTNTRQQSTLPIQTVSSGTSSSNMIQSTDDSDTSNSSEEDYHSDESLPPPIVPRLTTSKSGLVESRVTEQMAKVEIISKVPLVSHKSVAVSVPMSVGKPRLPSPPSEVKQQPNKDDEAAVEDNTANFKKLSKQIRAAKKKIKDFEADFEEEHGFKPSLGDKMSYPDIKKYVADVTAARKQIAELRTESQVVKAHKDTVGKNDLVKETHVLQSSVENTLMLLVRKLNDKRKEARRPEEISQMSMEDLKEEKICLQKALLHFETLHGRPSSVSEKQLMHPLYERYRKIKRILERHSASDDDDEEDDEDDNRTGGGSSDHGSANTFGNTSFVSAATRNTMASVRTGNTLKDASMKSSSTVTSQTSAIPSIHHTRVGNDLNKDINGVNLHTLSTPDLLTELERTQQVKKHLQIELHNFEQSFVRKYGRRLQREDRMMKELEYREYKAVKSKLKLLEALLDKRERSRKHVTLPNGL